MRLPRRTPPSGCDAKYARTPPPPPQHRNSAMPAIHPTIFQGEVGACMAGMVPEARRGGVSELTLVRSTAGAGHVIQRVLAFGRVVHRCRQARVTLRRAS